MIKLLKDKVLKLISEEAKQGKETEAIVTKLKEELEKRKGTAAGLAANQLGYLKRIFVYYRPSNDELVVVINPTVQEKSKEYILSYEGCLSIPGEFFIVSRPAKTVVTYYNENWEKVEATLYKEESAVFHHEYDHLIGVVFIDYLPREFRRPIYRRYGIKGDYSWD